MEIFKNEDKKNFLDSLEVIRRSIPVMDMDDRDFTASVLYKMAQIVREHGPNHGVNLEPPKGGELRVGDFVFRQTATGFAFGKVAEREPKAEFKLEDSVAKVIYNPPATIIYWKDGTKTVVKCSDQDFDLGRMNPETGVVYAIAKKVLGNKGNYNDVLRRIVKRAKKS